MAGEETERCSRLAELVNAQAGEELRPLPVVLGWANLWVAEKPQLVGLNINNKRLSQTGLHLYGVMSHHEGPAN